MGRTLLDKIWDAHTVRVEDGGRCVLYIDRQYIHEVTSPVAFAGIERRGFGVARPAQITATADHNIPTVDQHLPIGEPESRRQVETLAENCARHGIEHFGVGHPRQGIVHIIGPELGFTQPGMTIVCGDSHTSTHGALGAVAFGVGTSEVEMVFASQCILQTKPRTMRITVDGALRPGVEAKDVILYIISKLTASGGTGHFIEFAGSTIRSLSMEGRMTVCNMSIECGARGGMIAPDEKTFEYLRGRERAPQGAAYDEAVARWRELYSDPDAVFDREYRFDAADIAPMISYGTNPGMGMAVDGTIPADADPKALEYMGFRPGERMLGKAVDYVFVGSCTNGRIEDLRRFARLVEGRRKADNITAWIVPGSKGVEAAARAEGLDRILAAAGFELRQPGCSACLAMNADKIPAGKYSVSTSNRNFEGRQGPGARTMLSGVAVAAAAAVTLDDGAVAVDHRDLLAFLLRPQDRTVLAVDAHAKVVVVADGELAGPVAAGRAALILDEDHIVVIEHAAGDDDVHLGQHAPDLQARQHRHGVFHMRAEVAQAVDAAGLLRVAAPFALLAAPLALIGEPALRILRHDRADLAELALGDVAADMLGRHMAHIGVGHEEEQALFLGQCLELLRLLRRQAQRLVARDMDPGLQEGLAGGIMRHVRRDDGDKVDPVFASGLCLRHFIEGRVAAVRRNAELRAGLAAFFRRSGKAARHQLRLTIQIDRAPVRVAAASACWGVTAVGSSVAPL